MAPFFLASAPVSVLDQAKQLIESRGGYYAAGDKDDIFNSMTLGDQESWKVGWKGKVEMLINILKKQNHGQKVIALAIAGGPACDWERGELHNTFCKSHKELVLKQLGDMEDLEAWLNKHHPIAAAGAPRPAVMEREGGTGNRSASGSGLSSAKVAPAPPPVDRAVESAPKRIPSYEYDPAPEQVKNFRGPCVDCCKPLAPCCCVSADGEAIFCCVPTEPNYFLPACLHMALCPQLGCNPRVGFGDQDFKLCQFFVLNLLVFCLQGKKDNTPNLW